MKRNIIAILLLSILISFCSSIDYLERTSSDFQFSNNTSNQLSLLTYNIKAIYEKEVDQIESLLTFVNNQQYDFVIFQELFDESTRDMIIELSDSNQYKTFISRVDYNSFPEFIFQDAGLFMMSKFPRIDLSEIDFGTDINNCNGAIHMILEKEFSKTNDFLANKSVLGVLFKVNNNTKLFLFTTHVQAIGSREHKEFQLSQINNFMKTGINSIYNSKIVTPKDELIVILAGDFNSNAYSQNKYTRLLNLLGYPRDLHKEYNGAKQEYTWNFHSTSYPRRFDYIFAFDSLADYDFNKLFVNKINVIDIQDNDNKSISDHRGLQAIMKFDINSSIHQNISKNQ